MKDFRINDLGSTGSIKKNSGVKKNSVAAPMAPIFDGYSKPSGVAMQSAKVSVSPYASQISTLGAKFDGIPMPQKPPVGFEFGGLGDDLVTTGLVGKYYDPD